MYSPHSGEQLPRPGAKASALIRKSRNPGTTQNVEKQDRLLIWKYLPILYLLGCGSGSVSKGLAVKAWGPEIRSPAPVWMLQCGGWCFPEIPVLGRKTGSLGLAGQPVAGSVRSCLRRTQDIDLWPPHACGHSFSWFPILSCAQAYLKHETK